MSALKEVKG